MGQCKLLILAFIAGLSYFFSSCGDSNVILDKQDFDKGAWLLIDRNRLTGSLLGINDHQVLKEYSKKLIVNFYEEDKGTTCDAVIELYKNGKLVNSQEYLSGSRVSQPNKLRKLYHPCKLLSIQTPTIDKYKAIFDSLKTCTDTYPIINIDHPNNKDYILYFKLSDLKNAR